MSNIFFEFNRDIKEMALVEERIGEALFVERYGDDS